MSDFTSILRIDASARTAGSVTRSLADETLDHLAAKGAVHVTRRDVSKGIPFVDEAWVTANVTPPEARTPDQAETLAFSDMLVEEIKAADTVVIATPIYNFGIPASLKAWIDMVARARVTFKYTDTGPKGLLQGKRAIILVASGGTAVGSAIDFATPYLKHALGFIGIHDVTLIAADTLSQDADEKRQTASQAIAALA